LNLPLAEAALFRLSGHAGLQLAALIGPASLAALLVLYYAGLNRLYGRAAAGLATMTLASIPALATQAAGGNADVPLALYLGGASLYLLLWWRLRRPLDAMLVGLLAGGAIWTKKEGLAAAALVIVALVLGEVLRRRAPLQARLRPAIGAALAALVIPLPWLIFTHTVHPLGRDFLPLTPAVFVAHADRLPHIVASFALQMLDFANWSLLWLVLAGVLLLGARRLSPCGRGLLLLLAGQLAVYALAFVFSDWQPYTAHVQTSLDRLLAQATPLALLTLVEAVQALRTRAAASVAERPLVTDEAA
jgi:4-amino-4-deoxy-L-arabinose transferase-like glycosyltransferase